MNKEEYAIDEKTYENYDGLKIKINDDDIEQHSKTSETYTELLANIDNTKNLEVIQVT